MKTALKEYTMMQKISRDVVRIHVRELEEMMWKTSLKIAAKHPMSISDALLSARVEEDDEL
jgi:hypothetical protein